jgi:hypothetical protein
MALKSRGLGVERRRLAAPGWFRERFEAGLTRLAEPASGWSGLDLDEHAGGDDEAVEGLDGAGVGFGDVDDALVRADLELLARLLVDVGSGTGPATRALVRLAWSTISFADESRAWWS